MFPYLLKHFLGSNKRKIEKPTVKSSEQKRKQQFITSENWFSNLHFEGISRWEIWEHFKCAHESVNTQIFEFRIEKEFRGGNSGKALEGILSLNTFPICHRLEGKARKQKEFNRRRKKTKSLLIREAWCWAREKEVKSNYVNSLLLCVCDKRKRRQDVWNKKNRKNKKWKFKMSFHFLC
jgi:hypothetical protein